MGIGEKLHADSNSGKYVGQTLLTFCPILLMMQLRSSERNQGHELRKLEKKSASLNYCLFGATVHYDCTMISTHTATEEHTQSSVMQACFTSLLEDRNRVRRN